MKRLGIVYNSRAASAVALADALAVNLGGLRHEVWQCTAEEEDKGNGLAQGTDLIVTVGGDGTILRTVGMTLAHDIPILGVNMGRLGFMTELRGEDALALVPGYLEGETWVERRTLLDVEVTQVAPEGNVVSRSWALNEAVVGRTSLGRIIDIDVWIDQEHLVTYYADGVIVATGTGSTGYALAAGGPILDPESAHLVLVPISPHLTPSTPVVVRQGAVVEMRVGPGNPAMASLDGQREWALDPGSSVRAWRSETRVAKFLRAGGPRYFYASLAQRLRVWGKS